MQFDMGHLETALRLVVFFVVAFGALLYTGYGVAILLLPGRWARYRLLIAPDSSDSDAQFTIVARDSDATNRSGAPLWANELFEVYYIEAATQARKQ